MEPRGFRIDIPYRHHVAFQEMEQLILGNGLQYQSRYDLGTEYSTPPVQQIEHTIT